MTTLTEARRAGEFILSEAPGYRSREVVTIAASQTLVAGAVLGKVTQGAKTAAGAAGTPAPAGATITAAPTAALNTKTGVHRFECIVGGAGTASKWRHTDPDGVVIGVATAGSAYAGGGLSGLTITDSGTDPTAGEAFDVTVTTAAASGQYKIHDPEGIDGTETVAGLLYDAVTTGVGETPEATIIARDAEVKLALLGWDDHDAGEKTAAVAALATIGIIARS
ncbi:MAG: head decoration protein [Caulobacter sp.]|nr:head decoration protein [Caulobacter sp.]